MGDVGKNVGVVFDDENAHGGTARRITINLTL